MIDLYIFHDFCKEKDQIKEAVIVDESIPYLRAVFHNLLICNFKKPPNFDVLKIVLVKLVSLTLFVDTSTPSSGNSLFKVASEHKQQCVYSQV